MRNSPFSILVFLAIPLIALIPPSSTAQNAVPMLINYQGELRSPTTGQPFPDGSYDMVFKIYNVQSAGTPLWEGTHSTANTNPVQLVGGIFSVILGSGTGNALDASLLSEADRWLEIRVGTETLAPRQRITSAAYSIVSEDSRLLDGKASSEFADTVHAHSGSDITTGIVAEARIDAAISRDSERNSAIAAHTAIPDAHHAKTTKFSELTDVAADAQIPASIARDTEVDSKITTHAGIPDVHHAKTTKFSELTDIATDAQIPATIARDSEIMPTVLANDGTGSTLDADRLDGKDSADFAASSHNHSGADITSGTVADARIAATIARDAEVDSKITTHAAIADAHHTKTTSFSDLTDTASDGQIPSAIARDTEVTSAISTHSAIADAHHARYTDTEAVVAMGVKANTNPLNHDKTASFTELTGSASDAQIPASIARDSEIMPTVLANDGTGSGLDADRVDGMEGAALEESAEIDADITAHASIADAHHTRYTNSEAVSAMGTKADTNPLHHDKTTSLPWGSITSVPPGFADGIDNDSGAAAWSLTGNAGTSPGVNFLGTTDSQPLELRVNKGRALRLEWAPVSPNVIGGYPENNVASGVHGATIGGGGEETVGNRVSDHYGTVGGGIFNRAGNDDGDPGNMLYTTIGGGQSNLANGYLATIAGGFGNEAGDRGTVSGGERNVATGSHSAVGGGDGNIASGISATIGGGYQNEATEVDTTVAGGTRNRAIGVNTTIGGGAVNEASMDRATIAGGERNTASGWATAVGGGFQNTAGGDASAIGGGRDNVADGWLATIGGGYNNIASNNDTTVGGGKENAATGFRATVSGGELNHASGGHSAIGGGDGNVAGGRNTSVGGGLANQALADFATISGGAPTDPADPSTGNLVSDDYGTIGGGGNNRAGDDDGDTMNATYATVGGGLANKASGLYTTVGGGSSNTASSQNATVGGGAWNTATDLYATVGGGGSNNSIREYATVGGGAQNWASGIGGTVGGGAWNTASELYATVGGGSYNAAKATYATISGGGPYDPADPSTGNLVTDDYGTIGGGGYNQAGNNAGVTTDAVYATVGGGSGNTASWQYATIGGGWSNKASGASATVAGGGWNTASAYSATVGGGTLNTASGEAATVGGGEANTASNFACTVGGGEDNIASDIGTTVAGGQANTASEQFATVGGGYWNIASGIGTTIGGGAWNIASGREATVPGGLHAEARCYGQQAYASGEFLFANLPGCAQTSVYVVRNTTNSTAWTELFLDGGLEGGERMTIPVGSTWVFEATVVGRTQDTQDSNGEFYGADSGCYVIRGVIENAGGLTTMLNATAVYSHKEDPSWIASAQADDGTDALVIRVSGDSTDPMRWVATVRTTEVMFPE